ncbi:hypothetical protein VQ042_06815 [Aurantimonas sp. A2-1-M11]|uniref:hypothetical protein n=1 Tax=Aurantimonas sp. A2-1-M11 TaxID=3113712 RepID=UPI002F935235
MIHHAAASFWKAYNALPAPVRSQADKKFALLKADPDRPSLRFKPIGRFWSARIGLR